MNSAEVSLPTAYATNGSNILAPTSFRQKGRTKSTKHSLIKQHVFHNNPLPGWRKEVNVNLNYKMRTQKGNVNVLYYPPDDTVNPLSSDSEIKAKLHALNYTENLIEVSKKFTTRKPYCICHSDKHKNSEMVECKYGKAGCNCRFHPSCMGRLVGDFGPDGIEAARAKQNTGEMGFICPLCSEHIEEMQLRHTYCQYTLLKRKEIVDVAVERTLVENHIEFKEYKNPFHCWGILGIDRPHKIHEVKVDTVRLDNEQGHENEEIFVEYQAPYVPSNATKLMHCDVGDSMKSKRSFVNLLDRVSSMVGSKAGLTSQEIMNIDGRISSDIIERKEEHIDFVDSEFRQVTHPLLHGRFSEFPRSLDRLSLQISEKGSVKVRLTGAFMKKMPYNHDLIPARLKIKTFDGRVCSNMVHVVYSYSHSGYCGTRMVSLPLIDGDVQSCGVVLKYASTSIENACGLCGYCFEEICSRSKHVNVSCGTLSFQIHAVCGDAMFTNAVFLPESGWNQKILPGAIYNYKDEKDNPSCYLCGLSGGILQFFQFRDYHNFTNHPKCGVLCHIPCIQWLNSNFLTNSSLKIVDTKLIDYLIRVEMQGGIGDVNKGDGDSVRNPV